GNRPAGLTISVTLGARARKWCVPRQIPHTETNRYLRNAAVPRCFERGSHISWWRPDCLAEDAVSCELVSAPKFSANREINREFSRIRPSTAIFGSNQRVDSIASSRIPCATEQGISKRVSGKIFQGTGNPHADIRRRSAH